MHMCNGRSAHARASLSLVIALMDDSAAGEVRPATECSWVEQLQGDEFGQRNAGLWRVMVACCFLNVQSKEARGLFLLMVALVVAVGSDLDEEELEFLAELLQLLERWFSVPLKNQET